MSAYVINLTINTGTDFIQVFDLYKSSNRVIDLTNYTAASSLRKHKNSSTSVSFTVGFPDRKKGKIKISIPSWVTSRLKPGKYVYDILLTNSSGDKRIVVEGTILARAGVSTGCSFSTPTSAQRLCIAVIDENDSNSVITMDTLWSQFRSSYPNRTFYLLQPTNVGFGVSVNNSNYNTLSCPNNFLNETIVNIPPLI